MDMEKRLASDKVSVDYIEEVSKKTGNPYKALRITIGNYKLRKLILLDDDQIYIINQELNKKG